MTGDSRNAALISMPEIAELAGVERPVVSTWRRRHSSFPTPVEAHGRHPMFEARAVVEWLISTGRAKREEIEPDLRLYALTCLGGNLPAHDLLAWSTALICLHHLDGDPLSGADEAGTPDNNLADLRRRAAVADMDDDVLRAEIESLPPAVGWLPGIIDELIEAAWGASAAYERLLIIRHRLGIPAFYADAVTAETTQLIARLSGAREYADLQGAITVCDLRAGAGDLLLAVLEQLGEGTEVSVTGAEPDPFLTRLTRRRLMVHGLDPVDVDLCVGDNEGNAADSFVVQLPYRPKEDRTTRTLAEVVRLAKNLCPGQTAVVLGPADLLIDASAPGQPGTNERVELLKSGIVEAIVRLPGGLMPFRPAYQMGLWVLRHPDSGFGAGRVLLADVSDRSLTKEVVDDLVADVITWRRQGHRPDGHARRFAAQVAVASLMGSHAPLLTRRPVSVHALARPVEEIVARVADIEADLETTCTATRPQLRSGLAARPELVLHQEVSLRDLRISRRLALFQGSRISKTHVVTIDLNLVSCSPSGHRVLGPAEVLGDAPIGARSIDRFLLAERHPRAVLTEPGDVLVTLTPRFGVHLDPAGYAVVEFPVRVLRINRGERQLTPRVLAALLAPGPGGVRAPGAVRASTTLDQLRVRLLPPSEVERLDTLLAVADERRRALCHELDLLGELTRTAVTGLADGALTITAPPIAT